MELSDVASEVWVVGEDVAMIDEVTTAVTRVVDLGGVAIDRYARWLADEIGDDDVVFAHDPDGRDVAASVAERLGREMVAGCISLRDRVAITVLFGGATTQVHRLNEPFVATVQIVGATPHDLVALSTEVEAVMDDPSASVSGTVHEPDAATVSLADADRIVGGGAGLADEACFDRLGALGAALGASMGATRVIADRGWVPFARQIGTTGTVVDPRLYLAFGISGAVQHTAGLGAPDHVISVNTDPSCPMSQLADLCVIADATLTMDALIELLGDQ